MTAEGIMLREEARVAAAVGDEGHGGDQVFWRVRFSVEKRLEDIADFPGLSLEEFMERFPPYEIVEGEGNLLVTAGATALLNLLIGAGGTAFNNANSFIGVGDSSTAASVGQTDLQAATNKLRKAMNATFPSVATNVVTFQSNYTSGEANFAWNEWGVFNASSAGTMLNRKQEALGTKSGGTWTFTVTITIS